MKTRIELKESALKQLENNWATAVVATLIYMLLSA
jgi:hypothetical protein